MKKEVLAEVKHKMKHTNVEAGQITCEECGWKDGSVLVCVTESVPWFVTAFLVLGLCNSRKGTVAKQC